MNQTIPKINPEVGMDKDQLETPYLGQSNTNPSANQVKVAIVHDYFFQFGGAEKVVQKWLEMYPQAEVFTSFFVPEKFAQSPILLKAWEEKRIHTTWLQTLFSLKFMQKFQKHLFFIYPLVMSLVRVQNFSVALISSTYCGKNVKFKNVPKVIHYCHSPTRYLHGLVRETDLKTINPILRRLIPLFTFWLKWLDLRAVAYLNSIGTIWIANSKFIQQTIREIYHTDSTVIYPPIELHTFGSVQRDPSKLDDFYFYFGRISFHKKVDLIVQACLDLGRRVKIAGLSGFAPEMQKLRQMVAEAEANHPSKIGLVEFIERRITDQEVKQYLSRCRAFLFPAKEDSGMIPVEVISSGTPVIAYAGGGALEYIQNGINGIFFNQQTVEGLVEGIRTFEASQLPTPDQIKQTVLPFGEQAFTQRVRDVVGF